MKKIISLNTENKLSFIFFVLTLISSLFYNSKTLSISFLWLFLSFLWGIIAVFYRWYSTSKIDYIVFLFLGILGTQFFFSAPNFANRHLTFLVLLCSGILIFPLKVFAKLLTDEIIQKRLAYVFILISVIECGISFLQLLDIYPPANNYFKISGTFSSPNFLAVFLSLLSIYLIWNILYNSKKKGIGQFVFLLLNITVIVLTKSRTAIGALSLGALFLVYYSPFLSKKIRSLSNRYKIIGAGFGFTSLFFGLFLFYFIKQDSLFGRFLILKVMKVQSLKSPIFGNGLFSFVPDYNLLKSHYFISEERKWDEVKLGSYAFNAFNEYLTLFYQSGVLALFVLLLLIVILFRYFNPSSKFFILSISLIIPLSFIAFFMPISLISPLVLILLFALTIFSNEVSIHQKVNKTTTIVSKFILMFSLICFTMYTSKFYANNKVYNNYIQLTEKQKNKLDLKQIKKVCYDVFNSGYSYYEYGKELVRRGFLDQGILELEKSISLNNAPKLIEELTTYYNKIGNLKRVKELLELNTGIEPFRYNPRTKLLNFYNRIGDSKKGAVMAKSIIELGIKVPSEEVFLHKKKAQNYLDSVALNPLKIKGTLTQWDSINSYYLKRASNYRVYLPNINHIKRKLPVIYLTDGQHYSKSKFLLKKVDELIESKKITPIAIVFIDPRNTKDKKINHRQEYFLCNINYVNFIVDELLPKVEGAFPISNKRDERTVLGHSFGGLFSAYLGAKRDYYFKNIAMQSPAFHPCPDIYNAFRDSTKLDLKLYMSYGTGNDTENQDLPMIKILQEKGYELKINKVEGGNHEWKIWMNQIEEIMMYYFSL